METNLTVQWIMLKILAAAGFLICLSTTLAWSPETVASDRFIRLNDQGNPITGPAKASHRSWSCVMDKKTGLIWEVKSQNPGLHYRFNTYSWFNPDIRHNGGLAGFPGGPGCRTQPCDTGRFVEMVNKTGWCNAHDWRLPSREELRSLVDYHSHERGPTLDHLTFPNTTTQFYWSAESSASNPNEAWGIGFAYGFDYAYYKNNRAHVRLVRQPKLLAKKGSH